MERKRFSEPVEGPSLVPDTIPEELLAVYQAEARAVVAATVTPGGAMGLWNDRPAGSRSDADSESATMAAFRHAARPHSRLQRLQAMVAVLAGYLGLVSLTAWWGSLAQTEDASAWWTLTAVGAAGVAMATLALLAWAGAGVSRRRRHRVIAGSGP